LGGAMVELAVILPVLLLFAIGVMDYGRVFFRALIVANAARAGAEYGAYDQNATDSVDIRAFAKLEGQEISGLKVTSQRVCRCGDTVVSCLATCAGYGPPRTYVEVTAVDTVALLLKYPGLPSSVPISRTATFRTQN
jgi:Flp pilus assembly protein TadG